MKICIERNYNNHIEVNNLFTRLIGKPYKGTGVRNDVGQTSDFMHYPPVNDGKCKKRIVFNYVKNGYKLISFPEFKKMIMSDKKYTKQDWLDGKVALNLTDLYLLSAFVKDCNPNNSNLINSKYNIDDQWCIICNNNGYYGKGTWNKVPKDSLNGIPAICIKELVLNTLVYKDKVLVGYKLKKECFKYEKAVDSIIGKEIYGGFTKDKIIFVEGMTFTVNYLKNIEILDKWFEEVWEDKKPELPQILGYNGIDKGSYIKYGCAEIPKSWFTDTRNRVPIEIKFDSNKVLNKEQIEAIIKYCAVNK